MANFPMPEGTFGSAILTDKATRRSVLQRWFDPTAEDAAYALWIGMNPSTANADLDDPTINRECTFTKRLNFRRYVKVNVADLRSSKPKNLILPGVTPISPGNQDTVLEYARSAGKVIVCFGNMPVRLERYAKDLVRALCKEEITLHCFGMTRDGNPKHPLYLKADTPIQLYTGGPHS